MSEKCHSRSQPKYSAFTLAGHVPGAPQWPCALANRDVNKISQTFSQYSNIQVFQLQVDSQCLINGESISSSRERGKQLRRHKPVLSNY